MCRRFVQYLPGLLRLLKIRKTKIKFSITNANIIFVMIVMKKLTTNQLVFSVERKSSKEFYLFENNF
jgi:DNA polymerase elongation subunit (family B)